MTNTENRQTFIRFADVREGDTITDERAGAGLMVTGVLHHYGDVYLDIEGVNGALRRKPDDFVAVELRDEIRDLLRKYVWASRFVICESSGDMDAELDELAAESGRLSKLFGLEWGADLDPRLA